MKFGERLSPAAMGCGAFLITLLFSVFVIVALSLFPMIGQPGAVIRVMSYIGSWGGLAIGLIVYFSAKGRKG